jgi:hypothetical protein
VHLKLPGQGRSVTIPSNALLFRKEGLQVGVVRSGIAELVPVKISRDYGNSVEIVSGLQPTDAVIVDPSDSLAASMPVRLSSKSTGGSLPMKYVFVAVRYILTSSAALVLMLLVVALEACTLGPKNVRPSVPTTPAYKEQAPASFRRSDQWQPAQPADQTSRGNWWEVFGDPELNQLEEQIASSNQTLKVSEALFREARAAIRFNRASQFPTISTTLSASYVKNSDCSTAFPSKVQQARKGDFVLPFDLSYEVDLWAAFAAASPPPGRRRGRQRPIMKRQRTRAGLFRILRSADAQKKLLDDTVKAYTDNLELTENRFKGGVAPRADVAQAQTQLDTTLVQDTDVTVQRKHFEHAIAILIGKPPADFSPAQHRSTANHQASRSASHRSLSSDNPTSPPPKGEWPSRTSRLTSLARRTFRR